MPVNIFKLINTLDIGNRGGGAEAFAVNLAISLQKAGENVTIGILCRTNSKNEIKWVQALEKCGIGHVFLNSGPHRNLLHAIKAAAAFCKQKTPDIVHSHSQIGSLVAAYLKMRGLVPLTGRTAHITIEWGKGPFRWVLRRLFTNWIFPRVFDVQVAISEEIKRQLLNYRGLGSNVKPIIKIPNALSTEYQRISILENQPRYFPRNVDWKIVSVGRLAKQKGYDVLIKSMPAVIEKHPNAHLTLVGEGKEHSTLQALISRLQLNDRVTLVGQKPNVAEILIDSDLFVLPSYFEGLPTVILEAMACGIPVIASRLPGVMEIIDDKESGLLVEPGNVAELANAINHAMESGSELYHIRTAAFQRLEKFQMDRVAREYLQVYQGLLVH